MRQLVASGSPFEREIGFSRAVRVGNIVEVAGTAPVGADAPGDVYTQTKRCLAIIEQALREAGAEPRHVTRTRVMLTDMSRWREIYNLNRSVIGRDPNRIVPGQVLHLPAL